MTLEVGKIYHGFRLELCKKIREIASTAHVFSHAKSGARLLYIENEDDNKVFSVTFRTPPTDSTGVAHIVEHSVLCGSRKFPLKEPFVELVKGSLNTYLNAMTFPDKTMYPVASRNDADFQNLMDVYLDAVFYPCMYECPEILMQEGWHYELEEKDAPLQYKGVVYNEMKGAFSSPEALLDKEILTALFPDTTYGFESGGDPEAIPDLTQEMFLDFHRRFYHPSNSYIYLYGAMDIEKKLAFLDEAYLCAFDRKEIDSKIAAQSAFGGLASVTADYPISESEQTADKTFLSLNYVVGNAQEAEVMLAMQVLEHFLLRTQAAPLKKALVDAGIGKDVLSSFSDSILQPTFSIISSGANADKTEKFLTVVRETLQKLAQDGIDPKLIEASVNLLEFRLREADFGHSPKGLVYNIKLMNSWLYDGDPLLYLSYDEALKTIKREMKNGYFERLIRERLLGNSHGAIVVLKPNPGMGERRSEEIRTELDAFKAGMSQQDIEGFVAMTEKLVARQETPDTPEALAAIPLLKLSDIEPNAEKLIIEKREENGVKVLFHEVATNQIAYLNLYFDASAVSQELLPYAYLFSELLGKVSTKKHSYEELANEINTHTGGVSCDIVAYTDNEEADLFYPKFKIKSKALVEKLPQLCALVAETINESVFTDKKRVRELIEQTKASLEMYLLRNAQQVVASRILSYFSPAGKYNEQGLLSFYEFVTDFDKNFDSRYSELGEKFDAVANCLLNRKGLLVSITLEAENYAAFCKAFGAIDATLREEALPDQPFAFQVEKRNEGFMTSSKIQYVGKGANFRKLGFSFNGSLKVLETILRYDYLWNKIRVQGGAYGAFAQFRRNGNVVFGSYRDPNLAETVGVYDRTSDYLRNFSVDEREMTKYIIGTMSGLDTPLTPQMKGQVAAECHIRRIGQQMIQKERDEVLATRRADIAALADLIDACMKENYLCVLGGEKKIEDNRALFGEIKHVFN